VKGKKAKEPACSLVTGGSILTYCGKGEREKGGYSRQYLRRMQRGRKGERKKFSPFLERRRRENVIVLKIHQKEKKKTPPTKKKKKSAAEGFVMRLVKREAEGLLLSAFTGKTREKKGGASMAAVY